MFDWSVGARATASDGRKAVGHSCAAFKNNKQSWWRARFLCLASRAQLLGDENREEAEILRNLNSRRLCALRKTTAAEKKEDIRARLCLCMIGNSGATSSTLYQSQQRPIGTRVIDSEFMARFGGEIMEKNEPRDEPAAASMMMHSFIHHRCSKFTSHTTTLRGWMNEFLADDQFLAN